MTTLAKPITMNDAIALFGDKARAPQDRANALGTMIDYQGSELASLLPSHVSLDRIRQLFVLNVKKTPKLLDCDLKSLMMAVYTSAQLGLEPDPILGQLYILPYKQTAQVIIGYKGLLRLVRNSGLIASIKAEVIYENDEFNIDLIDPNKCFHKPAMKDRGDLIAVYAVARFKDEHTDPQYEFMTKHQVDAIRARSASSGSGPWVTDYAEMARKTVLRRLIKQLPISTTQETGQTISKALELDNEAFRGKPAYVDHNTGEVVAFWDEETEANEGEQQLAGRLPLVEA